MQKWLAISNAAAGSSDDEVIAKALTVLREVADVTHLATHDPADLAQALSRHPDADLVVAMGGDGSLHAVVQALHEAERLPATVVGLVPLGTGNDFARSLDLPDDPVDAARVLVGGRVRSLDLVVDDEGQVVVNAAHVGLGARAGERAEPLKRFLGPLAYVVGTVSTLFSRTPRLRVQIDQRDLTGRIAQVAVGNGRFVGGGGELLPHAVLDDGVMDVAVVRASTIPRRISYALHLRRGTQTQEDYVEYMTARTVSVEGESLTCTNDGELGEPRRHHSWRVVPGGLRMRLADPDQPTSAS